MLEAGGRVLAEAEDGVGLLTFHNPAKLNAMSVEMWREFEATLAEFAADERVRVLILTGAGPKAFNSGADIAAFGDDPGGTGKRDYDRATAPARARLAQFPKPLIARVRGYCLGDGLAIALQADLRIAAVDSEFGAPASRLGLANPVEMVQALAALVGPAHAKFLLFTGVRIEAAEAGRIGLVNRVVRDEDLSDVVVDLARAIADNAPLSIRAAKRAVDSAVPFIDRPTLAAAIEACTASADYNEGRRAFLEKRQPRFRGQ